MIKPRVLFVSRTRYRLPLNPSLAQKWDALAEQLELRVLASSTGAAVSSDRFELVAGRPRGALAGALFWLALPARTAVQLRRFHPDAVVAQSPYEAAAVLLAGRLAHQRPRVITDVQGDWRTATRLYGSNLRALLAPVADAVAGAALRRVDAVRTISPFTSSLVRALGIEPAASFPTFVDLRAFTEQPPVDPPASAVALFVGVLEAYKNVDGLADGWRRAHAELPGAELHIVGRGSRDDVVRSLLADCSGSVRWTPELDAAGVARALDECSLLVLPSRSEGMGRVVIEAFCRARPVIGTRVGGIPDLVVDGSNGVLVAPGDTAALAQALVRLLGDPALGRRLGTAALESAQAWVQTPQEFAGRTRALVETTLARAA